MKWAGSGWSTEPAKSLQDEEMRQAFSKCEDTTRLVDDRTKGDLNGAEVFHTTIKERLLRRELQNVANASLYVGHGGINSLYLKGLQGKW